MIGYKLILLIIINICYTIFAMKYFMEIFFEMKKDSRKYFVIISVGVALWQIYMMLLEPDYIASLTINLGFILIFTIKLYNGDILKKIMLPIVYMVFWLTVEILIVTLCEKLNIVVESVILSLSILSKIIMFAIICIIKSIVKGKNIKFNKYIFYGVGLICIATITLILIYFIFNYTQNKGDFTKETFVLFLIMFVTNILLLIIFELTFKQKDQARYTHQLELKIEHNKEIENMIMHTRKFNHDVKNHFIALRRYAVNDNCMEITNYLDSLLNDDIFDDEFSKSNNTAIDAIINAKNIEIEKNNIKFTLIVDVPIKMYFKNSDLSVILGNILDNAIEANEFVNENKKYIDLKIVFTENRLTIACINATNNKITINPDGLVSTTKKDKENHGFGLVSIKNVCEKYSGIVNIDSKHEKFTIKCILFVNSKEYYQKK